MKKIMAILALVFLATVAMAADATIFWNASDRATGYQLEYSADAGETWSDPLDVGAITPAVYTSTHTGQTFEPVIVVDGTPDILWTFSDGTTSTSATPTKDFGTAATRQTTLQVTPWSAVVRINVGYDGGDGGSSSIETVTQQNVTDISGLNVVKSTLQYLCVSNNTDLTELYLDDFINLTTLEAYYATGLEYVSLHNCPRLSRICFENCDLEGLDISECPNLADLLSIDVSDVTASTSSNVGTDTTSGTSE